MLSNTLIDWEIFAYPNPFSSHIILKASEQPPFRWNLNRSDPCRSKDYDQDRGGEKSVKSWFKEDG
ncbi:MAG: hypothetical protein R3B93_16200 [Bacteroidia bacterium]